MHNEKRNCKGQFIKGNFRRSFNNSYSIKLKNYRDNFRMDGKNDNTSISKKNKCSLIHAFFSFLSVSGLLLLQLKGVHS